MFDITDLFGGKTEGTSVVSDEQEQKPTTDWSAFTFEEHLRAYLQAHPSHSVIHSKLWPSVYRVNVHDGDQIIRSEVVKCTQSACGYVFKIITAK